MNIFSVTDYEAILQQFEPISLAEMEGVKLMNRIDTKFAMNIHQLPAVLLKAKALYFVQEIGHNRLATYDTVYYDTDDWDMYMRHHNRQLVRQKIRVRKYVESHLTFLEIKRKTNQGRTKKKRIAIAGFNPQSNDIGHGKEDVKIADFIEQKSRYTWDMISPHLRTFFRRITLVNKQKTERVTIDLNLEWTNILNASKKCYPDLVVVEVKRDGNRHSPIMQILNEARVHPFKISKYCIGTALTTPGLKKNRFKDKIRRIEKMLAI